MFDCWLDRPSCGAHSPQDRGPSACPVLPLTENSIADPLPHAIYTKAYGHWSNPIIWKLERNTVVSRRKILAQEFCAEPLLSFFRISSDCNRLINHAHPPGLLPCSDGQAGGVPSKPSSPHQSYRLSLVPPWLLGGQSAICQVVGFGRLLA